MECPYYRKVQDTVCRSFVKGYCEGLPAGGVVVPSLKEKRNYCLKDGGYLKCPVYRSKLSPIYCPELTEEVIPRL